MRAPLPNSDAFTPQIARMPRRVANAIVARLKTVAGVRVDAKNEQFLTFRLNRRLQTLGLDSYDDYLALLEGPRAETETARLVEMLVTHTTSFFREVGHFEWLERSGLPALTEGGAGRLHPLTIWSAACSTGPELWSAGMVMDQFSRAIPGGLRWGMVGTDISTGVLRRAAGAIFTATELSGVNEDRKRAYFLRSRPGVADIEGQRLYRVAPELRNRATFSQANLLQDMTNTPLADVIFLRNVLIYFGPEDRKTCLTHVTERLRSGGYLILGHSDNHLGLPDGMTSCGLSIFRKA